jgi:hypothetical protein
LKRIVHVLFELLSLLLSSYWKRYCCPVKGVKRTKSYRVIKTKISSKDLLDSGHCFHTSTRPLRVKT